MNRVEKREAVEKLRSDFGSFDTVFITLNKGLNAAGYYGLRREMRASGASHVVAKNKLVKIAIQDTKHSDLSKFFVGSTSITFANDPVSAAKVLKKFCGENFEILAGYVSNKLVDASDVAQIASLPSMEELRAKLLGTLQAPASKLVRILSEPSASLARVLSSRAEKMS